MSSKILADRLREAIQGEVLFDSETLEKYSRDASLFKVRPQVVVFPKNEKDLERIVNFTLQNKKDFPNLSITARSAGTDMSGGAIGEGIVLDFTKHFSYQEVDLERLRAVVEPGVFYRDFEKITLPEHVSMPVYPASKGIAAFGGMIMNNCGSENSLRYGQMRDFVEKMDIVLANAKTYSFEKISMQQLESKKQQNDFEGEIYRRTFDLIDKNYDFIKSSKPKTTKNSSGYALWDVYDKEKGTFDMTQLFTGSQGTLGLMSSAKIRVVEMKEHKRLVTLFFKSWDDLPKTVNKLLPVGVQSMETFDDVTLKLGLRFMREIAKKVNTNYIKFLFKFWPEFIIGLKLGGLPKLIVLVEIAESSDLEADQKVKKVLDALKDSALHYRVIEDVEEAEKYWTMRRESFNLLREKVKDKQTAPFIDDVCVLPEHLPKFLPKLIKILDKFKIPVNIVGHAGDGNLHIIPLMNLNLKEERDKIVPASNEIYALVNQYKGTITAEHNDGIIRTPYVQQMFGEEMYKIFEQVKDIFDPNNIFNPGKKVRGSLQYMENHIVGK